MFFNYLKILLRNLVKRKTYTIVNVLGLAIGLASFILIMLYIANELSYDRYHSKAARIERLCMIYDFGGVGENSASMPFPVAFTLKSEYPHLIKEVVRLFNFQSDRNLIEYGDKKFNESHVYFADSTFFRIFDYTFLEGDALTALDEPFTVVITKSMAHKYFGDEEAMGKTLRFEDNALLKVSGVIEDVPKESHFTFDFIASMGSVRNFFGGRLPQTWVWNPCWTYLVLADGVSPEQVEKVLPAFRDKYFYDAQKSSITMYLQKLTDIHLHSRLDYEMQPNSNYSYIVILSVIAVFLLLIAAINFMNLSTATSGARAREIGIRKVTGAYRINLILQFIGESLVLTFIAMILALILIEIILPVFNNYTGKEIHFAYLARPVYLFYLLILWLIVGIVSGAYPAFYLASFKPIAVLKGSFQNEIRGGLARKILVIFQFTISIILVICTIVIFKQVKYMRGADLGFNPENVIMLPIFRTNIAGNYQTFKNEILANPDIISVSAVDDIVGASHNTHEFRHEGVGEKEWRFYPALVIMDDFVKTFEIKIVAGRDYNRDNKTDPMKGILINESMVRHLGWKSNEEALGQKFKSLSGDEKVIGVFKDFQASSLKDVQGPFVLNMKENPREIAFFLRYMAIRTSGKNQKASLAFLEKKWNQQEQHRPFEYMILKNELGKLYKDETNLGILSLVFTLLIMFVAAMGLFGLASFMAEKRTKEIGIRKVMGASIFDILILLQKDFAKLIIIATLIAWPLAYFTVQDVFLNQFSVQVPMNVWVFILAGFFALLISMLIISYRALVASLLDPAKSLRYE